MHHGPIIKLNITLPYSALRLESLSPSTIREREQCFRLCHQICLLHTILATGFGFWSKGIQPAQDNLRHSATPIISIAHTGADVVEENSLGMAILQWNQIKSLHMRIIDNGDYIQFWEDKWIGSQSLKETHPRLYSISKDKGQTLLYLYYGIKDLDSIVVWSELLKSCEMLSFLIPVRTNAYMSESLVRSCPKDMQCPSLKPTELICEDLTPCDLKPRRRRTVSIRASRGLAIFTSCGTAFDSRGEWLKNTYRGLWNWDVSVICIGDELNMEKMTQDFVAGNEQHQQHANDKESETTDKILPSFECDHGQGEKPKKKRKERSIATDVYHDNLVNLPQGNEHNKQHAVSRQSAYDFLGGNQSEDRKQSGKTEMREDKNQRVDANPSQVGILSNGLVIQELRKGTKDGKIVASGKEISVYYTGKLMEKGVVFESKAVDHKSE
ncbi:hypothetical protein VNO77_03093 [Canavalia gladiata]|uniref:peptidylprolyl isomerase n=1 Tax=Canavalia gladiata TaxID=3824 RepID=A0AAN9MU92_CANGL